MDETNKLIDSHTEKLGTPNAETVKEIGGIGTSSNPMNAINEWIKNTYNRGYGDDQVM